MEKIPTHKKVYEELTLKLKDLPFCSVIVLNYFGEKVLLSTIKSLIDLEYPKDKFEIVVVDNNSKDKSKEIISDLAEKYSNIQALFLENNYGFSKGNNFGIKKAIGKYVVLLNNDCVVDKNWLRELVNVAESDPKIFAVNSKILLYPQYFDLKFTNLSYSAKDYFLVKSLLLELVGMAKLELSLKNEENIVSVPYDVNDKSVEISLICKNTKNLDKNPDLSNLKYSYSISATQEENGDYGIKINIDVTTKEIKSISYDLIQNAGIMVFQDGYGRDIGSLIRYQTQNYEIDIGQYEKEKEIYAACGAAVLYRKDILDKLGGLNESFFMYYEDVDISEKARINGYRIVYAPKAIVRHIHALSSKEWSPSFIYQVEKGRLMHVFFNFPMRVFFKEYIKFSALSIARFLPGSNIKERSFSIRLVHLAGIFYGIYKLLQKCLKRKDYSRNIQYLNIALYFLYKFVPLYFKRRKNLNLSGERAVRKNYSKILSGDWYFSQ